MVTVPALAYIRREKLEPKEVASLLTEVSGKSSRDLERVLVSKSTESRKADSVRVITNELSRITIDVDQEFLELMKWVKELKGNPEISPQDLFKAAMLEYVKKTRA